MASPSDILRRKDEHLDIALQARGAAPNGFDDLVFEHCALPELDLARVDISTEFLGRRHPIPYLISAMTGGPARGEAINARLAEAAEELGIPLAVGSQRVALEAAGVAGLDRRLRARAPTTAIWSNLGAAQLVQGYGIDEARRAVEMIGADALVIHLNPLQEAVQTAGDRNWRGVLPAIEHLASSLDRPVVVKEVGYGISASVARWLRDAGVAAIDVAGAGGTAWAAIEGQRAEDPFDRQVAAAFDGWGIPTPVALAQVRAALPDLPLVASGGVRNGVDAAKAVRLGANLVGQAAAVLADALQSAEAVVQHFKVQAQQLRVACFCAGAADLAGLTSARLSSRALPLHHL